MHFSGEGIEGCLRNITCNTSHVLLPTTAMYTVHCTVYSVVLCTLYSVRNTTPAPVELGSTWSYLNHPAWSNLTVLHCNHWVGCIRGCIGKVTKWIIVQLEIPHTPRVNTCNNDCNTQYVHDSSTSNLL